MDRESTVFDELPSDSFAKVFKPKPCLCGKVMEVEIDGIHFMSYPTLVSSGSLWLPCSGVSVCTPVVYDGPMQSVPCLLVVSVSEAEKYSRHGVSRVFL